MFEIFVAPEVQRRGLSIDPRAVDRFLVELPPNKPVEVRLGEEAHLAVTIKREEDGLQYLDSAAPHGDAIDPNSGWVAYFRAENGAGVLGFDFRRNLKQAQGLLQKAATYLDAARKLGAENLSPALYLLHSAAELTVQALMLLESDASQSHKDRREWLKRWTSAGNSPTHHSDLLDNLAALRDPARYEPGDPKLKRGRFERICAIVQEMIDATHTRVGHRASPTMAAIAVTE